MASSEKTSARFHEDTKTLLTTKVTKSTKVPFFIVSFANFVVKNRLGDLAVCGILRLLARFEASDPLREPVLDGREISWHESLQ